QDAIDELKVSPPVDVAKDLLGRVREACDHQIEVIVTVQVDALDLIVVALGLADEALRLVRELARPVVDQELRGVSADEARTPVEREMEASIHGDVAPLRVERGGAALAGESLALGHVLETAIPVVGVEAALPVAIREDDVERKVAVDVVQVDVGRRRTARR